MKDNIKFDRHNGATKIRPEQPKVTTPGRYAAQENTDTGEVNVFKEPLPYFQKELSTKEGERRVQLNEDTAELEDVPPTVEEVVNNVNALAKKVAASSDGSDASDGIQSDIKPENLEALLTEYVDLNRRIASMDEGQRAKAKERCQVLEREIARCRELLLAETRTSERQAERRNQESQGGPSAGNTKKMVVINGKAQRLITSDRGVGMYVDAK